MGRSPDCRDAATVPSTEMRSSRGSRLASDVHVPENGRSERLDRGGRISDASIEPIANRSAVMSMNVAEWLWHAADDASDHPAIVTRNETTTYEALRARASDYAHAFLSAGVVPGDRVAILLSRGADAAAAYFGAVAMGGVGIIIDESLRPRQIEHILEHSGAVALVTSVPVSSRLQRAPAADARLLFSEEIEPLEIMSPVSRLADDVALLVYTSGSTGLPKGVTVSHGNLHAGTDAVVSYLGIRSDDRLASLLPFSFDYGFNQLLCAMLTKATLVVERSPLAGTIVESLASARVSVLAAVPPLWLQLIDVPAFRTAPLTDLRVMTNTGGHLPVSTVRALRASQPQAQLFLMYGLTEAFRATYLEPDQVDRRPGSIGKAIPGSEIMVLRDDLTRCKPHEIGEVVQRGSTVTLGYWNDARATEAVFRPNPLRPPGTPPAERVVFSGDLAWFDEDGFLFFVGRRDRMIKSMGHRVSPDEVTDALYSSELVKECAVTTEMDPVRGDVIVAHAVLHDGADLESLVAYSRRELPGYMQPGRFMLHQRLPRTTSGKQDVKALEVSAAP